MFLSAQSDLTELEKYPRLRQSWQWYSDLCAKLGRIPARQDINPADIKFALGYELLVEINRESKNPRVRLIGVVTEEFFKLANGRHAGKDYDTFLTEESQIAASEKLTESLDQGQPIFGTATYTRKDGRRFGYVRIIFPLQSQNDEPEMVFLIFQDFTENEDREIGAQKEEAMKRWS
ncbi:hypothetical protein WH95_02020 [Kiloniella litopenaei]|uniref:PAS domain-containing protein n=1 Tax=Kiloniella litopenaei TaxID=1549748 RepID=A0A0M2REZ9_9PROT|nr:PAS domain-containing protein [Kiloniella litopenaei]KKJ78148.1 hypothetical protein WH95_02020 [Kiloniella litopenaei]